VCQGHLWCQRRHFHLKPQIIEANEPKEFFSNPKHERTKLFLSQILH
jgi:ABC-type polar amino acid transport system ATPase subunit